MSRASALTLLVCAVVLPAMAAPKPTPPADLEKDARLSKKLSLAGEVIPLRQVAQLVNEATGVDVMVQGDLLRRPIVIAAKDRSAAEILSNVALLFGGTWIRRGDAYLLVSDEITANLVASYPSDTSTDRLERAPFASLSQLQAQHLRRGDRIAFDELTPGQKRLINSITRDRFLREPQRYPSSILTGKGIALVPARTFVDRGDGRAAVPTGGFTVELEAPEILADGTLFGLSFATFAPR